MCIGSGFNLYYIEIRSIIHEKVEVYTTPTCEDCKNFKQFLKVNNIAYTDYDIADHPEHADTLRKDPAKI